MPRLPFRKKKKKDLPKPPSFTNSEESSFQGPPKLPPLPQPKIVSEFTPPSRKSSSQDYTGPPRTSSPQEYTSPPRTSSPQEYTGPPRTSSPQEYTGPPLSVSTDLTPPSSLGKPPTLTPPPISSRDILSRPPFPEPPKHPSFVEQESPIIENKVTNEILKELRQTSFGSGMLRQVPKEKAQPKTLNEVSRNEFEDAKVAYIEAGNKHIEMNLHENAAINLSCAVLCVFLGEGVYEASEMMSKIASGLPSDVINSNFFQGVRLLLKTNLTNSSTFFAQAEKWLTKDTEHLYKEDVELIQRAIRQTRRNLRRG